MSDKHTDRQEKNACVSGPLSHLSILLTRPLQQSVELAQNLQALGADVIEMPMIEILPPASWQELDNALNNLGAFDWIFFASANAAQSFVQRASLLGCDLVGSGKPKVAVIGKSTEKYLRDRGIKADYVPADFVAESFVSGFPAYPQVSGLKILWPRTNIGRDYIAAKLSEAKAQVTVVQAYRTVLPSGADEYAARLRQLLRLRKLQVIAFLSGQAARNFAQVLALGTNNGADLGDDGRDQPATKGDSRFANLLRDVTLVSIGPETTKAIHECGLPAGIEAKTHDATGLVQEVLKKFGKN